MCSISVKVSVTSVFFPPCINSEDLGQPHLMTNSFHSTGVKEGSEFCGGGFYFTWNEASLDDVFIRPPTIIELGCEGLSCGEKRKREGY